MDEILMQLGKIGRLKTKETTIDEKRTKKTDAEMEMEKAIAAYNAMEKSYSDYKSKEKHKEFLRRLDADPKPNSKPLGKRKDTSRTWC